MVRSPPISSPPISSSPPENLSSNPISHVLTLDFAMLSNHLKDAAMTPSSNPFNPPCSLNLSHPSSSLTPSSLHLIPKNPLDHASPNTSNGCRPLTETRITASNPPCSDYFLTILCDIPKSARHRSDPGKILGRLHPTITIDFWGVEPIPLKSGAVQPSSVPDCLPLKSLGQSHVCSVNTSTVAGEVGSPCCRFSVRKSPKQGAETLHGSSLGKRPHPYHASSSSVACGSTKFGVQRSHHRSASHQKISEHAHSDGKLPMESVQWNLHCGRLGPICSKNSCYSTHDVKCGGAGLSCVMRTLSELGC